MALAGRKDQADALADVQFKSGLDLACKTDTLTVDLNRASGPRAKEARDHPTDMRPALASTNNPNALLANDQRGWATWEQTPFRHFESSER